jgi:alkylation response protein AidB-like acyl-CoA dehydrogenase
MAHSYLGTYPIVLYGTESQKEEYLPPSAKGVKVASFALTEPDAGSDVMGIRTTAHLTEDHYVLNGRKVFVTNGTFSDFTLVVAYTDRSKRREGISIFILDKNTPGFHVTRKQKKEGNRSSETAEILLEDCQVDKSRLLGQEEGKFKSLMSTLSGGRILIGARGIGLASAAFQAGLRYAKERMAFGRPIGSFQINKFRLAEMAMGLEAARLMVYKAAWMYDLKAKCVKEASMAKVMATDLAVKVANQVVQLYGGYGQMREFPVGRYLRDSKVGTIGEGSSEIQHLIVARELGL